MSGLDPISQDELKRLLLVKMIGEDNHFRKSSKVRARPAQTGERIVTVTSDGVETEKLAEPGDFLVENQTEAKEIYLVPAAHFNTRYEAISTNNSGWTDYLPSGEIAAIVVGDQVLQCLGRSGTFNIMASWGSTQRVEPGDYLVTPLPEQKEIYRVGKKEFEQTYISKQPQDN